MRDENQNGGDRKLNKKISIPRRGYLPKWKQLVYVLVL